MDWVTRLTRPSEGNEYSLQSAPADTLRTDVKSSGEPRLTFLFGAQKQRITFKKERNTPRNVVAATDLSSCQFSDPAIGASGGK